MYDEIRLNLINPRVLKIGCLSATFSSDARQPEVEFFFSLLGRDFEQILGQIICLRVKTLQYKFGSVKAY